MPQVRRDQNRGFTRGGLSGNKPRLYELDIRQRHFLEFFRDADRPDDLFYAGGSGLGA